MAEFSKGHLGQPGNRNAAKAKTWEHAIRKALARASQEQPLALGRIADKLVARALQGDDFAVREIGDRLDGKPKASTEHTGANGSALFPVTHIAVTGVEPQQVVAEALQVIAESEDSQALDV
jgi:hypothetical protein